MELTQPSYKDLLVLKEQKLYFLLPPRISYERFIAESHSVFLPQEGQVILSVPTENLWRIQTPFILEG